MRQRLWPRCIALFVLGTVGLSARQGPILPPTPGTALVVGRVVDATSNQPISGVAVSISGAQVQGRPWAVVTDAQGRFVFRDLAKGSYTILASVGGNGYSPGGFIVSSFGSLIGPYLPGGVGQLRPMGPTQSVDLADGERVSDATIRMWRPAAIEGVVVDESEDPEVGHVVTAIRLSSDGRLIDGPTTKTDDRGVYRFGTLEPGTYVVCVPETQFLMPPSVMEAYLAAPNAALASIQSGASGATAIRAGVSVRGVRLGVGGQDRLTNSSAPRVSGSDWLWAPTAFAPSATSVTQAARIVVRAGETRSGVTVHTRALRTVSLSGTLSDPSGPVGGFGVHLLPADAGDGSRLLEVARTSTDASGAFVFPLVPPGQYVIKAIRLGRQLSDVAPAHSITPNTVSEEVGAWAIQPVTVGESSVAGVQLTLRPGAKMSARLVFEGSSAPPKDAELQALSVVLVPVAALFRSDGVPILSPTSPSADERAVVGIIPGRYVLRATVPLMAARAMAAWTLSSVVMGGRDITDAGFVVDTEDLPPVVMTFRDRASGLQGSVPAGSNSAEPSATVLVFSTSRERWADARTSTRSFKFIRVGRTGRFVIPDLVPGEYFVVAVDGGSDGDWPDRAWLEKAAARATTVTVAIGQMASVTLKVSEVR